ncbi:MAG TPA: GNAT family N-acetyltransferase [Acetobacteraceae bacterium]|nr:GNAT family N-acetyltransferase [Acetobacteraceae bacterium]
MRDVVHAAYAHYVARIGTPPGPMRDDYPRRIADRQVWVLEDAGDAVGILVLEESAAGLLLDNIAVLPRHQGKGHGRALMQFAEAVAGRRGYNHIRLYTHVLMTENIALYQRAGYVETHRITEKGFDRVYMIKSLQQRETAMTTLEIIGAPQSNFVRTTRIACMEKGVHYTLTPARPHSPEVDAIHPLGKIPAMRHGEVALCESSAICAYIDRTFEGPSLMPRDTFDAARTEQWISLHNTGIDPLLVRQYLAAHFFSGLPDGAPDRAKIDALVPKMREMFAWLDRELGTRAYVAGDRWTLADAFLLPTMHYMRLMPESSEMVKASPNVSAWFDRVAARSSSRETEPPPMPGRG